jgi:CheY-like chemotaxis protein
MELIRQPLRPPIYVLIVDDVQNNITALEASLARPDISVLAAASGSAALELLLKHEVALAILDVNMPGMDGFELAELMRGSPRTAHVPIIFLTATAQDTGRTFRGYEAGAVDFLYKPYDSRILNSKVDVFIQIEKQKQQLATQLATVQQLLDANEMLMAVLGHDLRTPLSAVIASAEYLARFVPDENVANIGTRIKSSGMRMVRMVDQLLNLARLRGGRGPWPHLHFPRWRYAAAGRRRFVVAGVFEFDRQRADSRARRFDYSGAFERRRRR